jgi:hypothetical protein
MALGPHVQQVTHHHSVKVNAAIQKFLSFIHLVASRGIFSVGGSSLGMGSSADSSRVATARRVRQPSASATL